MLSLYLATTMLVTQGLWAFAKTFGGTSDEYGYSIVQTMDGGFAVAGFTQSFGAGGSDILVLKLAPDGSLIWARTYGGTSWDYAYSIIQTTDGGYAVAGMTYSFGYGDGDFIVLKLASNGSLTWARTFGNSGGGEYISSIIQTTDGGYAVTGVGREAWTGNNLVVLKLAADGSLTWSKTFSYSGYTEYPKSIIQTAEGGYAVAGYSGTISSSCAFFVFKITSDGSLVWARTYGGASSDWGCSIVQTTNGGYAVAGCTESFSTMERDILVLNLNSDGSLAWARKYGGTYNDEAYSIIQTQDGGYAVAGGTYDGTRQYDYFVLKLASDGSVSWAKTLGGWNHEFAQSIIQTTDRGYAVTGWTWTFGAGGNDFLVLRLPSDGNYSGCVQNWSPTVTNVNPVATPVNVGADFSIYRFDPSLTITTPSPVITDVCEPYPLYVNETSPGSQVITYSPVPGGLLFVSPETMGIKIYSADGRLAYSGNLEKGQNRITLETGVYLWQVGSYKGKAVVR